MTTEFKPGQQVVLEVPQMNIQEATFVRYRTAEERDDWRQDDDCWVYVVNDISERAYPSKWLKPKEN